MQSKRNTKLIKQNMRQRNKHSFDTQKIQERIMPILTEFHKVCDQHNLTYYLWAGTQLGAIRHKGFIPWDDDADVAMPRKDYEVLMAHATEWLSEQFQVANHNTSKQYPHYFARLQDKTTTIIIRKHLRYAEGVHIDIFPLDNVPDGKFRRRLHFAILHIYQKLLYYASRDPHKDKKIINVAAYSLIQYFFSRQSILKRIDKHIQKHNNKECSICSDSFYRSSQVVKHTTLGEPHKYTFEGVELNGVENGDKYLREKYGDYMQIPSTDNRIQHTVDHLDLDAPYSEFSFD